LQNCSGTVAELQELRARWRITPAPPVPEHLAPRLKALLQQEQEQQLQQQQQELQQPVQGQGMP
jgi:hypothetical protein